MWKLLLFAVFFAVVAVFEVWIDQWVLAVPFALVAIWNATRFYKAWKGRLPG